MKNNDPTKSQTNLEAGRADEPAPSAVGETLHVVEGVASPGNIGRKFPRIGKSEPDLDDYVQGILAGDRVILGRTITLIESSKPDHNEKALRLLERLLPHTGASVRVGITGVPGVGKSTFIEALGTYLLQQGRHVAVLAIDPSSKRSHGSILGDKTRMESLSVNRNAFIRPSPSAGSLGGVARKTREAMLVCEAAGFDVVLIETIGVGQSETMAHSMVDFFLLLMLAGAGDQLQGIKRGIMELADAVAINKADGDNVQHALHAKQEYQSALQLLNYPSSDWSPPVHVCSSLTLEGIPMLWKTILDFQELMTTNGLFQKKRKEQSIAWMHDTIRMTLQDRFLANTAVSDILPFIEHEVGEGKLAALSAAQELLALFFSEKGIPSNADKSAATQVKKDSR